jgi:hypothetical protein
VKRIGFTGKMIIHPNTLRFVVCIKRLNKPRRC